MSGERIPLVMVPRYTSYVGPNMFTTVPLEVSEYASAVITLWRGELVGPGASFSAVFETSPDGEHWSEAHTPIVSAPGSDTLEFDLEDRWLRFRIELATTGDEVGITCWAGGSVERRIPGG